MKNVLFGKILSTILILSLILSAIVPAGIFAQAETSDEVLGYASELKSISSLEADGWNAAYSSDPQAGVAFENKSISDLFDCWGGGMTRNQNSYHRWTFSWKNPFLKTAALTYTAQKYKYFTMTVDYKFNDGNSVWPAISFGQPNTTPEMFYAPIGSGEATAASPKGGNDAIGVYAQYEGHLTVAGKNAAAATANSSAFTSAEWRTMQITVLPGQVKAAIYNTDGTVAVETVADLADEYNGGYVSLMLGGPISFFRNFNIREIENPAYTNRLRDVNHLSNNGWKASFSTDPLNGVAFVDEAISNKYECWGQGITRKQSNINWSNNWNTNPFTNMAALTYTGQKYKYFKMEVEYKFQKDSTPWSVISFNQPTTTPEMFYAKVGNVTAPKTGDSAIGAYIQYEGHLSLSGNGVSGGAAAKPTNTGTNYHKMTIEVTPDGIYSAVYGPDGVTPVAEVTTALPANYEGGYISLMQNGVNFFRNISITELNYYADYSSPFNNTVLTDGTLDAEGWKASFSSDPLNGVAFVDETLTAKHEGWGQGITRKQSNINWASNWNTNPFTNMAALTYTGQKYKYFKMEIEYKFDKNTTPWSVISFNQPTTTPEMFYAKFNGVSSPKTGDSAIGAYIQYEGHLTLSGNGVSAAKAAKPTNTGTNYHKMTIEVTADGIYSAVYGPDGVTPVAEVTSALPANYEGGYISLMQNGVNFFKNISIVEYPVVEINNYNATPDGNGGIANDRVVVERAFGENAKYSSIVPERAGFSFMGFYNDAEYLYKIDKNNEIKRDTVTYVKWSDFTDVTADGKVDLKDLVRIKKMASEVEDKVLAADLDFDGVSASGSDLTVIRKKLMGFNVTSSAASAAELVETNGLYLLGRSMVLDGAVEMDYVNTGFVFKGNIAGDVKADFIANRVGSLLNVSVDGGENKVVDMSLDGLTTLAEDLPKGEHTIEVISGTSMRYSPDPNTEEGHAADNGTLRLNKLYYSGTPMTYVSDKSSRILFLGDSITCGMGLDTSVENGYKASNAYYTYASVLGRKLNAEVETVARCGSQTCHFAWATSGRNKGPIDGINWLKSINLINSTEYDYANNQPDVVVINLGSNDIPYSTTEGIKDYTGDKYKEDVTTLLKKVNQLYPNAKIIWTVGMVDRNTELSKEYIGYFKDYVETWSAENNNLAYFLDLSHLSDLEGYNGHPTIETHSEAAEEIYSFMLQNNIGVNMSDLTELSSVQKKNNSVTLAINTVNDTTENLELTFPTTGGIRLTGSNAGLHDANYNYNITCQTTGDIVTITAENGHYVKLNQEANDWSINLYNSNDEKVNEIKGSQIYFGYNDDGTLVKTKIIGSVSEGETFTGLGEKFNGLVQNGEVITLWNKDSGAENFSENGDKTASYINIPLLNSTKGYSIFLNSTYKTIADIGATDKNIYTLDTNGNIFDVYCFVGETKENLNSYTNLTGKSALPPKWAFSYMAGNHSTVWNKNADPVKYLSDVMAGYENLGTIPSAVYGEYGPEYQEEAYDVVAQYGSRMIGWQDSGMYLKSIDNYMNGIDGNEYPLIKTISGNKTYMSGGTSGDAYIDFTNPLGNLLFKNRILSRLNMGWKGGMIDFGDEVLLNSISYNGIKGEQMRNLYPYYYTKGVSEVLSEALGDDHFAFSRSGSAGSQKFMAVFTGDQPSTFQGLKQSLYGGLSLSSSGYSIWGSDLGGFGRSSDTNDADLYRRWLQFSTFNPIMRAHGMTDRNPWCYKEGLFTKMNDVFVKYYWLRENFVDAIYSSAIKSSIDGSAMTQPLMNAFPNQSALYSVEDEYMFCDELLVAPIVEANTTSRKVTFPSGNWVNFWTGETVNGGNTLSILADKNTIPLFLRSGAIMSVRLNSDFKFGTDLNDNTIINALMLTSAEETRNITVYTSETESINYITSKTANGTTSVKAEKGSNVRMIILKGVKASSIIVDGTAISSKSNTPTSQSVGYKVSGNDTYVYLPQGEWNEILFN